MIKKTVFLVIIYLTNFTLALASGIQVSPAKLDFNISLDGLTAKQLVVVNPETRAQTFEVYAEDYPSLITVEPNDFALQPGGTKTVTIAVNYQKLNRNIQTQIDVLAGPLPSKSTFAVSAGVKIPITIVAGQIAKTDTHIKLFRLILSLAALILLAFIIYLKVKKRAQEKV